MERKDVRMLEPGEHPNFADKPQLPSLGGRVRVKDFDGYAALVSRVAREIDGREGTLPNLSLYLVTALQGRSQRGDGIKLGQGLLRNAGFNGAKSVSHGLPVANWLNTTR